MDQLYGTTKAKRVPGRVRIGWVELGYLAACEAVQARCIVERMASLGQLEIEDRDDLAVTARFVDWDKWQGASPPKDPEARDRKREERARKRDTV